MATTDNQADKTGQRRQDIITAAMTIFAEKGFQQASMNDIVRAAGMSKGGVYWHFSSKDELILAVMEHFFTQEMAALTEMLAAATPVAERIRQLLQGMIGGLNQMGELLPIAHDFYALAAREGPVRSFMQDYFHQYTSLLAALVQQGVNRGEFRTVDATAVAVAIAAQFEGLALLWSIDGQNFDLDHYFQTSFQLLLQGLHI